MENNVDFFVDDSFNRRFHIDKVMVDDVIKDNFRLWFGKDFYANFHPQLDAGIKDYPNVLNYNSLMTYQGKNQSVLVMKDILKNIMDKSNFKKIPGCLEAIVGLSFEDFIKNGYFDYNYFAFWQLFKMKEYDLEMEEILSQLVAGDIEIIILFEELSAYIKSFVDNLKKEKYITANSIQIILDTFDKLFSYSNNPSPPEQIKQFMHERALLKELMNWIEKEFLSDTNIIPYSFLQRVASKEKDFALEKIIEDFSLMKMEIDKTIKNTKESLKNGLVFLPGISNVLAYYSIDDKKKDNLLVVYTQNMLYEILAKYYSKNDWQANDINLRNIKENITKKSISYYANQMILTTLLHEYAHAIYKRITFPKWKKIMTENKLKLTAYGSESIEEEYCEIFSYYWASVLLNSKKDLEYYNQNLNPEILKFIFVE